MTLMHVVITKGGGEPSNQVFKNGKQNLIFGTFVGEGSGGESIIALTHCKKRRGREHHGSVCWVFAFGA